MQADKGKTFCHAEVGFTDFLCNEARPSPGGCLAMVHGQAWKWTWRS